MDTYIDRLVKLRLFQELRRSANRSGIEEDELKDLETLIYHVADTVHPDLQCISNVFRQYTSHDIRHSLNIIDLVGRFIPQKTLRVLNGLEITMLILSALLHDIGMVVTTEERKEALESDVVMHFFAHFPGEVTAIERAKAAGHLQRSQAIQEALLAEYFRHQHSERVEQYVHTKLPDKMIFREFNFTRDVIVLCKSHAWGVREGQDFSKPSETVAELKTNLPIYGVAINLQYLACCLRLGDIMDFDRSRTPLVVYQKIDFTEQKSWFEWNRHLNVRGWNITDRTISYACPCDHPMFYAGIMKYLDSIDRELVECHFLIEEAPKRESEKYFLFLPQVVDRRQVYMQNKHYIARDFRFRLQFEEIMRILMDKSLYPDTSLFLRELLQNSLDACRLRRARLQQAKAPCYRPRIVIWDNSDDPTRPHIIFQDNGTGMSIEIVENYLLPVGKSYYRSAEHSAEVERLLEDGIQFDATSYFGIGFLSCFLAADQIEVETYHRGQEPLRLVIDGPCEYIIVERLMKPSETEYELKPRVDVEDGPPKYPGTKVTLFLRPNARIDVYKTLVSMAVNIDVPVRIYKHGRTRPRVVRANGWETRNINIISCPDNLLHDENMGSIAENLKDVVAASEVPFHKWSFSRNLRGCAWFWLLRGSSGGVTPCRGYLEFNPYLKPCGLPELITEARNTFSHLYYKEECVKELRRTLRNSTRSKRLPTDQLQELCERYYEGPRRTMTFRMHLDNMDRWWGNLSLNEKEAAQRAIVEYAPNHSVHWQNITGVPKQLLNASLAWAKGNIKYDDTILTLQLPQYVAIRGILLPAGILRWNPVEGLSERVKHLPFPGGMLLDARGELAPVPVANRLFADSLEGTEAAVAFARACLRHMSDLCGSGGAEEKWRRWFNSILSNLKDDLSGEWIDKPYWILAMVRDLHYLENTFRICVKCDDQDRYLTPDEVVGRFGRWVPLGWRDEGIDTLDEFSSFVAAIRRTRESRGGITEVDMSSGPVLRSRSTLEEVETWWEERASRIVE